MDGRFDHDEPTERDRFLHAPVRKNVVDLSALALLADALWREHFVGRTGQLQIVSRQDGWNSPFFEKGNIDGEMW